MDFNFTDIDGLRFELTKEKYENALIFVAWEHNELERVVKQLVDEFGGDPNQVPEWKARIMTASTSYGSPVAARRNP